MIHEVTGDILLTEAEAIAHGISPNDHFDSGLAMSLREQRPALYKEFRHYLHTSHPKTGGLWVWGGSGGKRIINLFTQEPAPNEHAKPGQATYANLNHCLHELQKLVVTEELKSLAVPRLATGVGGLAWDQVWPLIKSDLGSLKIPIFIYSHYQKGVKAVEKGC
jgi:O-acetyl-ADP-ribose deacetylase (regulator of RNase III)